MGVSIAIVEAGMRTLAEHEGLRLVSMFRLLDRHVCEGVLAYGDRVYKFDVPLTALQEATGEADVVALLENTICKAIDGFLDILTTEGV